ncbi:MAG TPA: NF038122 family metalloprotease [Phenylobacterium sp.]|jgi:hypothetical protein|nr:NF038122 family metalloprotease [Phenylobacterium sp.]
MLGGLAGAIALAVASQSHALTVLGSFDSSITSLGNAAAVEASINSALQFYSVFTNPATVNILFKVGGGLGGSQTGLYGDTFAGYATALAANAAANPQNAVLQTALANLAYGNQRPDIAGASANFRALGYINTPALYGSDGVFGDGDTFDGVISLNTSIMNFTDTEDPSLYPADTVIQHEVDEILGVGGPGSLVTQPFGPLYMGAEDLYRYSGLHTASFTTNPNATSYFSIDGGATNIRGFNQGPNGDYADWVTDCSGAQSVQDWEGCPGQPQLALNVNSPEVIALQAIGYDLGAAVPEPSAWALMIAGLGMMGAVLRRRRTLALA